MAAFTFFSSFANAQTESLLYNFPGGNPQAGVAFDASGNLYGTTPFGGVNGAGTVYKISSTGTYSLIYSFGDSLTDASEPLAGITIDSRGNMFGTTRGGGVNGNGAVWEITSSGAYSVLYSFGATSSDAINPATGVTVDPNGNLFGTTEFGGANGKGALWEISSTGSYSLVYSFGASGGDAAYPSANVTFDSSGDMFGTSAYGGLFGGGTVWEITSTGTYGIYHSLGASSSDGTNPLAGVTFDGYGNMYGTTKYGGAAGGGTIWEITSTGTYGTLHSFAGTATDGNGPNASITVDGNANLFGTTSAGGANGAGTVWEISSLGTYQALYSFGASSSDGSTPIGGVTYDRSGNLYGTTSVGGSSGYGTVWEVTPPVLAFSSLSLSAGSVASGTSLVGTVALSAPAGPGGYTITLNSNSPYAVVPPNITLPEGTTVANFPIWTSAASVGQSATITATNAATVLTANLSLTAYSPFVFNVQVNPTFVVGGTSTTALVQLDHYVTTVGGEVVDLSASNVSEPGAAYASVPASVVVPFGLNGVTFTINTFAVPYVTPVSISATDGSVQSGLVMVIPADDFGLNLIINPFGINGGSSAVGTVTLSSSQSSDTIVSLSSNSTNASVPTTVTVPAGSTSATFTVNTVPVLTGSTALSGGWVWIACSAGLSSQAFLTSIYPAAIHYVTTTPSTVVGGANSTGTVYLSGSAPAGGLTVTLASSSADAQVPSSVVVLAGNNSASFTITTNPVYSREDLTISASLSGQTASSGFVLGPSDAAHYVSASPGSVIGGGSSTGTVALTLPAPPGGVTVTLSSSSPDLQVPTTVLVSAGSTSATFAITTSRVSSNETVSINATVGTKTVSSTFLIGASVGVHYVVVSPSTVAGGTSTMGSVYLTAAAPAGGTVVTLSSSDPSAQVPLTVIVLPGNLSATFSVTTTAVSANKSLSIYASLGGKTVNYGLLVTAPTLASITATHSATVVGGNSVTLTATLSGPAPVGGVIISLTSNSGSATAPMTVTVPAGATSAVFTVQTSAVTSTTSAIVTGTLGTSSARIALKIIS